MSALLAIAPVSASQLGIQAAKTAVVMVFVIVAFRLLGKRQMSQLNLYDLAMVMALANAVQNAMTGGRGNLTVGLVTSSTVVIGVWLVVRIAVRSPAFERQVVGNPVILVHDGHLLRNRARRQAVTADEIDEALRAHGLDSPAAAALVVLEVDGSISVVPRGTHHAHETGRRRSKRRPWVRHGPQRRRQRQPRGKS